MVLGSAIENLSAQSSVLGILEEVPGSYYGDPSYRSVRVVFQRNANGWLAFRSQCPDQKCLKTIASEFPLEVTWTVTFNGRNLGQITGRTPAEFKFYSHVGLQEISSTGPVPSVGTKSVEFGSGSGTPVQRPLVANSAPYYQDPDLWKPAQPPPELVKALRQEFRRKFGKLCRSSPRDETKLEPLPYLDENVKMIKGYASKRGWWVVHLYLKGAVDCADVEGSFEIDDPWFVAGPQRKPKYLDSGILLVDAGDYGNDGKSEVVFSINRENRGGYILYYDDFEKHATFQFGYH